ncbi:sensor histidine kinase KdpD, partial [Amycolatopsis sp. M39]
VVADEIIGAALSEVEDYQRIEIGPAPALAVRGDAVNDLVHVVSELLENATRYSGPQTAVTVESARTPEGAWRIEITDRGAGMPQAEIDRTNARLAHPPEVDVEVSRRMGLFVVATLAERHAIAVRLSPAEGRGLTATVVVPAALITEAPSLPQPPAPVEPEPASEPELLAPLAPLAPAEEPAEPAELVAPTLDDAGPLRRAPVVEEVPPWPGPASRSHLEIDAPTDRMPAYRDVLSRWFDLSAPAEEPAAPEPRVVAPMPEVPAFEPEHTCETPPEFPADDPDEAPPEWPTSAHAEQPQWPSPEHLEQEDGAEDTWPFLRVADVAGGPAAEPEPRPILSLSPDAVRARMTSLQGGFRRGRHARGEDTPPLDRNG